MTQYDYYAAIRQNLVQTLIEHGHAEAITAIVAMTDVYVGFVLAATADNFESARDIICESVNYALEQQQKAKAAQ